MVGQGLQPLAHLNSASTNKANATSALKRSGFSSASRSNACTCIGLVIRQQFPPRTAGSDRLGIYDLESAILAAISRLNSVVTRSIVMLARREAACTVETFTRTGVACCCCCCDGAVGGGPTLSNVLVDTPMLISPPG